MILYRYKKRPELWAYLINLAVTDFVMGLIMPFPAIYIVTSNWVFYPFSCNLIFFIQLLSLVVGIATNVVIAVDR